MLMSEGIRQYVEPHCVQRELSEVTGLSAAELDHAAHELIRRTASDPISPPSDPAVPPAPGGTGARPRRPPYYEHLGGYSFDELKDYNRYSPTPDTAAVRAPSAAAGSGGSSSAAAAAAAFRAGGLRARAIHSNDDDDDDDYGGPIYTTSV